MVKKLNVKDLIILHSFHYLILLKEMLNGACLCIVHVQVCQQFCMHVIEFICYISFAIKDINSKGFGKIHLNEWRVSKPG